MQNDTSPKSTKKDGQTAHVEGVLERIVYESQDTGFFVGRLRVEGEADLVTIVGNLMAVSPGETIRIEGRWVDDKNWGRQIRAESYETVLPSSVEGIEKYLGSGLIHGIGPVYASRLIKAFGHDTLRVIDEEPKRLRSVDGIGQKRAAQIRESWAEHKNIQSIMIFLQGHGVGSAQAVRIYKKFGDGAVALIRENPYRLAEELSGIGFKGADSIAESLGIDKESTERLVAGIQYSLQRSAGEGHVFLGREELVGRAAELLSVANELVDEAMAGAEVAKAFIAEGERIYLDTLYEAELGCDHHLKRLMKIPREPITDRVDNALQWVQNSQSIELSDEQQEALRSAVNASVHVITGGPGTGKTTLIRCLLGIFEKKGVSVVLAAPTGRAAKRMEEATGHEARTLHRLLEFSPKTGGFLKDANNPLSAGLVIIDECSMVDVSLMRSLLQAIPPEARLVLVGDVDQLPSVGPGTILMDIILSNSVATTRLKTVFRQAAGSGIIANAHRINRGEAPVFNTEDFFFVDRDDPQKAHDTVLELVSKRIPDKFGLDPLRDIQVLSPMHRGAVGVTALNESLQQALNPHGTPVPRRQFRVGDKVIQTRNNYDLDVYNGDVGVVKILAEEVSEIEVEFDHRTVLYSFDDLDNLALAYAITVHKSQGSEYPAVVIPLLPQHFLLLQRNVIYTAITRAKKLVILVGSERALGIALRNTDVTRRNTFLVERLRNISH